MPYKNRYVTISQAAIAAGASSQTVSRVINNRKSWLRHPRHSGSDHVHGLSTECHCRNLIQQRSHTLGVVSPSLEYFGTSYDLVSGEQGANQAGLSINLKVEIAEPYHCRPVDQFKRKLIDVSVFDGQTFFQPAMLERN